MAAFRFVEREKADHRDGDPLFEAAGSTPDVKGRSRRRSSPVAPGVHASQPEPGACAGRGEATVYAGGA